MATADPDHSKPVLDVFLGWRGSVLRLEPHRAPRSQGIPCPASRLALQQVVPFESMFIFSVFRRSVGVLYLRDLI